jgi:SAM-dependent methyltransferase
MTEYDEEPGTPYPDPRRKNGIILDYLDYSGLEAETLIPRIQAFHNLNIRMIESDPTILELDDDYELIFSDAVFEHLIDPCQAVSELTAHLVRNGFLLLLIDTLNLDDQWPMHRKMDFEALDRTIHQEGGKPVYMSPDRMFNLWQKE